jgi:hypothetical protein
VGRRSPGQFERLPQDAYQTPLAGVQPLLPYLDPMTAFVEPCVGEGMLAEHLKSAGHVLVAGYDLPHDARTKRYPEARDDVIFVTNPPWARPALHAIIANVSDQAPTWLLLDGEWIHTKQAIPFMPRLRAIVSVGRLKWIPGSPFTSKDSCVWLLFDRPDPKTTIRFIGRRG